MVNVGAADGPRSAASVGAEVPGATVVAFGVFAMVGVAEGGNVGPLVGVTVVIREGAVVVGLTVGDVGALVGTVATVGAVVSETTGTVVGATTGTVVGETTGAVVGETMGAAVGLVMGAAVGTAAGGVVGPMVWTYLSILASDRKQI